MSPLNAPTGQTTQTDPETTERMPATMSTAPQNLDGAPRADSFHDGFRPGRLGDHLASLRNDGEAGLVTRLRRQKFIFSFVFISVLGAAALILSVTPSVYLATGAVMVTGRTPQVAGSTVSPAAEQKLGDPADMDSQIVIAKSPRLLARMTSDPKVLRAVQEDCEATRLFSPLNRLRVTLGWPTKPCDMQAANGNAADWLEEQFRVASAGRSRIIQIAYRSPSPVVAASLVNGLINAYLAQGAADKQRSLTEAATWIHDELNRIGAELRQSELTIESFRREHGMVRGQTASITSERLTQVSQQLATAEAAASDATAKLDQLRNGAGDARQTLDSRTVADLKQKQAEVRGEIARFASSNSSSYPALVALQQQRADLQRQIIEETGRIKSSLESDRASAVAQVVSLRQQLADIKKDVGANDLAETQIASMVRDNDVKRELYVDPSKKANDLEAQRRLVTGDVELVNYAEPPHKVASPKPVLFGAAGLMAATILASAAALLRDRSDQTVRNSTRVGTLTDAPVLGHVPYVHRVRGSGASGGVALLGSPSALQEAIRLLYTRCFAMHGASRPRTLLIASANAGEGKSFLTLALAQFAAASGKRVLAIEADMRRPGWHKTLSLSADNPGLVDVLRGGVSYDDALRTTKLGFDVLPAGAATITSTELLSNSRITPLLAWARQHYDMVLVDSPPSQQLMDAHLLASQADAVLFCARWGQSPLDSVAEGVRDMRRAGGRVIGVALGMVKLREYPLYGMVKLPRGPYLTVTS